MYEAMKNQFVDISEYTTIFNQSKIRMIILSLLNDKHPSILSINDYQVSQNFDCTMCMVSSNYKSNISLQNIFDSLKLNPNLLNLTPNDYYIIILGIALGINYLHSNNITKIDLKPTNILIDKMHHPKILKINLYNTVNGNTTNTDDIFNFAEIIYQMITKQNPPIQINYIQNDYIKNFIKRCISKELYQIPTFEDIICFIISGSFRSIFGQIDTKKVIDYLRLFNQNNEDNESSFVLGSFLYESQNLEDKEEAINIFKNGANKGNINCILKYTSILVKNDKTGQNKDEIIMYFQKAIDKRNMKAIYNCAWFLQHNSKTKEDEEKVNYLYKIAADEGNNKARCQYGIILYKLNRKKEAAHYIKLAADFEDVRSIFNYAQMLETGDGIDKNIEKALYYYKKGMEKGDFNSMNNYAYIIFQNKNGNDKIKAVQYFKISADNGNKYAMCNYAYACYNGQGIQINKNEAINYYIKSIEKGNPDAMNQYGRILELNKGENNIQKAAELYKMAAEKGNVDGMNNLISLLFKKNNIDISKDEINNYCLKSIAENKLVSIRFYAKNLYENNRNDPDSIKESMMYLKKAADLGHVVSMYKYSYLLYMEYIKTKNSDLIPEMKNYALQATFKGNKKAVNSLHKLLKYVKLTNEEIARYLQKLLEIGSIHSMIEFVQKFKDKICDVKKIKRFFQKAFTKQNNASNIKLIKLLLQIVIDQNIKVKNDKDLISYIRIASDDLKICEAIYRYGVMLKNGEGVKKDYEKGVEHIKRAADENYLKAMRDYLDENLSKKNIVDYNSEHFLNEFAKYEQILINYKKDNNYVFVDENFPPHKNWKRIDDIYKEPLFKKELIDPNFINQGEIGDCYFISFLSRVAKQNYLVNSLFECKLPNSILGEVENSINIKCGAVVIYFYAFGKRIPVLIDTLIPMNNDIPIFSHPSDNHKSAWFCLVEKAYAKLHGSYENIDHGVISFPSYSLFSYYSKNLFLFDHKPDQIFKKFMKYQENGCIIESSICNKIDNENLVQNHLYLILKIREVDNEKLLCLRNPWGSNEFHGKYGRNSSSWTPRLKKLLDYDHCQMGTFVMTEDEFFKYFDCYSISKPIRPEWNIKSFSCKFIPGQNDGINNNNISSCLINHQAFAFQVTDPLPADKTFKIHMMVEICKSTFHDQLTENERSLYRLFFGKTNGKKFEKNDIKNDSIIQYLQGAYHTQSFKYEVKSNEIITFVIHRESKRDYCENCNISVFCEYNFKLYDIDHPDIIFPDIDNPGIAFDNYTVSFPNISKPLVLDYFKDRLVLNFDTISNSNNQNDFSKFFQYANKNVGFSHVNLDDYQKTDTIIGKGSNGKVYKIIEKKTNKIYAAKISNHNITKKKSFYREMMNLQSIKYPSIINYKGFNERNFDGKSFPTIITEYLEQGNLYDLLLKEKKGLLSLTNTNKMIIVIGIALGMEYLHRHKIIHRDLKFQNIILDENYYPRICDLGESKSLELESDIFNNTIIVGTELFMAPEIAKADGNYSYPVDVYSFGIMVYYIY